MFFAEHLFNIIFILGNKQIREIPFNYGIFLSARMSAHTSCTKGLQQNSESHKKKKKNPDRVNKGEKCVEALKV